MNLAKRTTVKSNIKSPIVTKELHRFTKKIIKDGVYTLKITDDTHLEPYDHAPLYMFDKREVMRWTESISYGDFNSANNPYNEIIIDEHVFDVNKLNNDIIDLSTDDDFDYTDAQALLLDNIDEYFLDTNTTYIEVGDVDKAAEELLNKVKEILPFDLDDDNYKCFTSDIERDGVKLKVGITLANDYIDFEKPENYFNQLFVIAPTDKCKNRDGCYFCYVSEKPEQIAYSVLEFLNKQGVQV